MGMDVDAVVAQKYIEKLHKLVSDLPHGKREQICDDIKEFYEKMKEKYTKIPKAPEQVPGWKPVPLNFNEND